MIVKRAKDFMDELGLPVTRFAKCVNLAPDTIRQWLAGTLNLRESNLKRIDEFLKSFNR